MQSRCDSFDSFLSQILIIVVLYELAPRDSASFQSLDCFTLPEGSIFLYDNSANPQVIEDKRVIYRHDPNNSGVARAYNEGLRVAESRGKHWLFLLDQDTTFGLKLLKAYFDAIRNSPHNSVFVPIAKDDRGIVSPFRWMRGRGVRLKRFPSTLSLDKFRFINSGAVISVEAFRRCGGYDERFGLDFSDIVFGERLRKVSPSFVVVHTQVSHRFSGTERVEEEAALNRFRQYCRGVVLYRSAFPRQTFLLLYAWLRAIKLSVKYRTSAFIRVVGSRRTINSHLQ